MAGSAYVYGYITMGEGLALVVGWNLVLEYAIGTASVARAYSGYLDHLLSGTMSMAFERSMKMNIPYLSPYPDICALMITLLLTVILSLGVKLSSRVNNVFTALNICLVIFVTITGYLNADIKNWKVDPATLNVTKDVELGHGGFFPFGISGTLAGAATCFYGYVGFDSVSTSGEEAINPQRSIPIAIVGCLSFACLMYMGISSSLTLMLPYYLQDTLAPIPAAFNGAGLPWAAHFVSIGALLGLSTSLIGVMFPLPRILYAMASDGILFRSLAIVNQKLQTPLIATALSGVLVGIIAMLFDLKSLVDMMSIGTLMAFTIVSICVLLLRYQNTGSLGDYMTMDNFSSPEKEKLHPNGKANHYGLNIDGEDCSSDEELIYYNGDNLDLIARNRKAQLRECSNSPMSVKSFCSQAFNMSRLRTATTNSCYVAKVFSLIAIITAICLALVLAVGVEKGYLLTKQGSMSSSLTVILVILLSTIIVSLCFVYLQPTVDEELNFKAPFIPVLPICSVFINSYLMMKLPFVTWTRFFVWLAIGLLIYACYGWRNSSEEYRQSGRQPPENNNEK